MATKCEITKKYTREYAVASKKTRGRLLDELVAGQCPPPGERGGQAARPAAGGEAGTG